MKSMLRIVLGILLIGVIEPLSAQAPDKDPHILNMRDRATVINEWLEYRLENLVPKLMRETGIDMWVLVAREYNEDPVLLTMLPATWQSSRRTTILIFFDRGEELGVERIAVARYNIGLFRSHWNPDEQPDQWERFAAIVGERNPRKIGVNISEHFAHADGISHTDFTNLKNSLNDELRSRIVSAEKLAIRWLETRTGQEMTVYRQINRIAHSILAEGLSEVAITPGITTTEDLQWWYRERIRERKLTTWFHPYVSVQRMASEEHTGDFSDGVVSTVIMPGDLIHVDFGIEYLRLTTDTQRHAYVLRPGETDAPQGLKDALAVGNRLQDILTSNFITGRSGNEILAASLEQAANENITASIYTHPLGFHGHGAGPTIGLWDQQGGVPGKGDYPLYPNTAHSIELFAEVFVPEWKMNVLIMLEEDAIFDGEKVEYIDGRMTELYLIPRVN